MATVTRPTVRCPKCGGETTQVPRTFAEALFGVWQTHRCDGCFYRVRKWTIKGRRRDDLTRIG